MLAKHALCGFAGALVATVAFYLPSSLLLFDKVKSLGTSLFASAGVAGIIVGVAAQKTLANLFAGFQIAMTQPIRLDDVVIVESMLKKVRKLLNQDLV